VKKIGKTFFFFVSDVLRRRENTWSRALASLHALYRRHVQSHHCRLLDFANFAPRRLDASDRSMYACGSLSTHTSKAVFSRKVCRPAVEREWRPDGSRYCLHRRAPPWFIRTLHNTFFFSLSPPPFWIDYMLRTAANNSFRVTAFLTTRLRKIASQCFSGRMRETNDHPNDFIERKFDSPHTSHRRYDLMPLPGEAWTRRVRLLAPCLYTLWYVL